LTIQTTEVDGVHTIKGVPRPEDLASKRSFRAFWDDLDEVQLHVVSVQQVPDDRKVLWEVIFSVSPDQDCPLSLQHPYLSGIICPFLRSGQFSSFKELPQVQVQ
jgi:hypothetical protein